MAQFARPDSDVAAGMWTTAPLFEKVDETVRSDADLISSNNNSTSDICELGLSNVGDPQSSTGHILRYTYSKSAAGGHVVNVRVRLLQGTTEIASFQHNDVTETFVLAEQTLTGPQADAITDYTDLRVEFQRSGDVGGPVGNRRTANVSWAEIEVPDAGAVTNTATLTLEAAAQRQGLLATTSWGAVGQQAFTEIASLDAAASLLASVQATLEAAGQTDLSVASSLTATAQETLVATATLDAVGESAVTEITATFDAVGEPATVTEELDPIAILASSNLQDSNLVSPPERIEDLQDDPDAPDAFWHTPVDPLQPTEERLRLRAPSSSLNGTQTIRVLVRAAGLPCRDGKLELWQDGVKLTSEVQDAVTSEDGQNVTLTFPASEVTGPTKVEVRIASVDPA